jgi:Leucine-rich repeat (LRR) protein
MINFLSLYDIYVIIRNLISKEKDLSFKHLSKIKKNSFSKNVIKLNLSFNRINDIPNEILTITNIKILDIGFNEIDKIKNLPKSLKELWIPRNKLTKIENLPNSLKELDISRNFITIIENLPTSLKVLWILNNPIKEIRSLPNQLEQLYMDYSLLEYIDPVLYKHQLIDYISEQNFNFEVIPKRLKLCYLYKIGYLIIKLQRWWRKKNIILKTKYKRDINEEIKCKPGVGIEYFNGINEIFN